MSAKTVLISGASVAGPALAYWLDRYGFQVTVVERGVTLRPGGQAIDFKGQIQLTVLERMGVREEILRRQTGRTNIQFMDPSGRQLAVLTGEFLGGDVEILRGDLAAVFFQRAADRCEYLFGDSIAALTETADGVRAEFENAPARTFDLVVGAYVLAGELAVADGDHTVGYARYNEIMRRYAAIAGQSNAGRFLAPRTALGIRGRNWFLGSRGFDLMMKYVDNASNDIELQDYPSLVAAA